jgi:hypothetical protein
MKINKIKNTRFVDLIVLQGEHFFLFSIKNYEQ